jgi:hypothetical protein
MRRKRRTLHHYFIPSHHNNFRPHYLQVQSILINIAVVVLLFLIALGVQSLVIKSPSSQVGAVIAGVLVDLANQDRVAEGLATLAVSKTLQEAAQKKADDMAAREYFAHESPDGKSPWYWFGQAGYDFRFAGENLAVYFSDSEEVEKAWMNSPLHRANILSSHFTEVGIALAHGTYQGHETTFVVQMFGQPASAQSATVASAPAASAPVAGASAEALDVIIEDETFIAVRREGPLAALSEDAKPVGALKAPSSNSFWRALTSPKTMLQYIYTLIASLIIIALSFLALTEYRRMHLPSFARGLSVLALIVVLLLSSATLFGGALLIV